MKFGTDVWNLKRISTYIMHFQLKCWNTSVTDIVCGPIIAVHSSNDVPWWPITPKCQKRVTGGVARVTWPLKIWELNAISSVMLKLWTSNLACMLSWTILIWPLKKFQKGEWPGSRHSVKFWELNGNSFKMAKDTNFKFGMHTPGQSPDMTPEKNSQKGAWPGSRDP